MYHKRLSIIIIPSSSIICTCDTSVQIAYNRIDIDVVHKAIATSTVGILRLYS